MLWYLYCAIPAASRADVSKWRGDGAPLETVAAGGVRGVIGPVPDERYSEDALAAATKELQTLTPYVVAHQAVVQFVFEHAEAVVPLAFGSVHRRREDVLAHLEARAERLRALLSRLSRMEEWGLRVTQRRDPVRVAADAPDAGTAYLAARRDALRRRGPDPAAAEATARLVTTLARLAAERRDLDAGRDDLVARSAFLVPARRVRELKETLLSREAELAAHGLVAELSGPWPAYSFTRDG